jgi:hypothetical protein
MNRGYLDQKQIADYSMQPTKETRETLYKMLRSGFVVLQDIPRTSDRAPSRTFYVWGADLQGAYKSLGREWGGAPEGGGLVVYWERFGSGGWEGSWVGGWGRRWLGGCIPRIFQPPYLLSQSSDCIAGSCVSEVCCFRHRSAV